MKKLLALVLVLGIVSVSGAIAAPLAFTISDDATSFGIKATDGFRLGDIDVTARDGSAIDFSQMKAGVGRWLYDADEEIDVWTEGTYPTFSAAKPYGQLSAARVGTVGGWLTAATEYNPSNVAGQRLSGKGEFDLFSNIMMEGLTFSFEETAGSIAIDLTARLIEATPGAAYNGPLAKYGPNDGVLATIYAVPEPMTMSLLGMGALALIRRRRA